MNPSRESHPYLFFLLLFLFSLPFYLFGGGPLPVPVRLPASALALVLPLGVAALLAGRRAGWGGVRALLGRAFDYRRIRDRRWYLPILLLNPLVFALAYLVMRLAGMPLPAAPQVPWLLAPLIFLASFVAAVFEELGWMGYAYEPLEARHGALKAALLIGLVWALWHLIPDVQNRQPAGWIAWHRLSSVAHRVLIVWLYRRSGRSVFAAVLYHAMNNLSWALFPNYGSHYNPLVTGALTLLAAAGALVFWRPRVWLKPRINADRRG